MDSKTNGFGVAKLDADKVTEHMELYDCCEISARRVMVYDIIMKDIQLLEVGADTKSVLRKILRYCAPNDCSVCEKDQND